MHVRCKTGQTLKTRLRNEHVYLRTKVARGLPHVTNSRFALSSFIIASLSTRPGIIARCDCQSSSRIPTTNDNFHHRMYLYRLTDNECTTKINPAVWRSSKKEDRYEKKIPASRNQRNFAFIGNVAFMNNRTLISRRFKIIPARRYNYHPVNVDVSPSYFQRVIKLPRFYIPSV